MIKRLKYLLVFCFSILFCISCNKKESVLGFISKLKLQEGVYIILIGVEGKMSDYIKKYNYIVNSKYNHIALLCIKDSESVIYDVHPRKIKLTKNISVQTINTFVNFSKNKINYFGIWKVPWVKTKQLEKLINTDLKITYDYKFENKSDSKLYCSEFVARIIDKSLPKPFKWIVLKRDLENPENLFLKKDHIEYYPVDFFLNNKSIIFINEWYPNREINAKGNFSDIKK